MKASGGDWCGGVCGDPRGQGLASKWGGGPVPPVKVNMWGQGVEA